TPLDLRKIRIGVAYSARGINMDPGVRAAIEASVSKFAELGATIIDLELPGLADYYDPANVINKAEGAAIHAQSLRTQRGDYSPAVIERLDAGLHIPATQYLDALRARARLLRDFVATVFERVDVLHFPVVGIETPTLEETADE